MPKIPVETNDRMSLRIFTNFFRRQIVVDACGRLAAHQLNRVCSLYQGS